MHFFTCPLFANHLGDSIRYLVGIRKASNGIIVIQLKMNHREISQYINGVAHIPIVQENACTKEAWARSSSLLISIVIISGAWYRDREDRLLTTIAKKNTNGMFTEKTARIRPANRDIRLK